MRNPLRMQRERRAFDAPSSLVVALDVIKHFVRVQIGVVVWNDDRLGMKVEQSRAERADHEVVSLKGLMRRWRHVVLAHNGTEVIDVEDVRVVAAVPPHDIERVIGVHVRVDHSTGLDSHFVVSASVVCQRQLRKSQVAFAVRRMLEELRCLLRQVARRRKDVRSIDRLHQKEAGSRSAWRNLIELHLIDDSLWNDDVVLGAKLERAKGRTHRSRSMMDEDALVARAALEPVRHLLGWNANRHLDIFVAEEHDAAGDRIALGFHRRAAHMAHAHDVPLDILGLERVDRLPPSHLSWWMDVIERRGRPGKTLCSKDFLAVERAVRAAKLNVAL